jgi:hypothetical protein
MKTDVRPVPRLSYLRTHRRATTGTGFARSPRYERRVNHFWCEHCGTSHRDPLVVAECVRLLAWEFDWFELAS